MKLNRSTTLSLFAMMMLVSTSLFAQKPVTFTVENVLNVSAEKVWAVVGEDFGGIAKSHPNIVQSDYVDGSLKSGEGSARQCNFNEKGTKYLKEKQTNYNPKEMTFDVKIYHAGGLPLDPDYSKATYRMVPIDENSCKFIMDMAYRTKPAFMGKLAKGKFMSTIDDYAIAIEHHARTGEVVNKDNFKTIKKNRKKA